jgi:addiction module HigA family antidote
MHNPAHPGEVLKDGWPENMTVTDAAQQLGITRATLSRILNGHSGITADMALRLQAWMGIKAEMWLRLQTAHDLWEAERKPRPRIVKLKLAA